MIDTLQHLTTITKTTLSYEVTHSMQPIEWLLLFFGWFMYWLKSLDDLRKSTLVDLRKEAPGAKIRFSESLMDFLNSKMFEVPISFFSLFLLAILSSSISPDLFDLHSKIGVFMAGYASSSILNGISSLKKPKQ